MKYLYLVALCLASFGCGYELPSDVSPMEEALPGQFSPGPHIAKPGSYIVAFRSINQKTPDQYRSVRAELTDQYLSLTSKFLKTHQVQGINYLSSLDLTELLKTQNRESDYVPPIGRLRPSSISHSNIISVATVNFYNEAAARTALRQWVASDMVVLFEPNYYSQLNQSLSWRDINDTYQGFSFKPDWQGDINLESAYSFLAQSSSVVQEAPVIAIMDSGVDLNHPHFENVIWQNNNVGAGGCVNDTNGCNTTQGEKNILGNGDVSPANLISGGSCPENDPNCSHGTHVAGIAAGINNDRGISGVCPFCKILPIRIVGRDPSGSNTTITDESILRGMIYITKLVNKDKAAVRILNASFGQFSRNRIMGLFVRLLAENQTLVIGAAGNEDTMKMQYPAGFSDSLAVAALSGNLDKLGKSNFGQWVDVAAPGESIESTIPGGSDYQQKSGTSMAAPVVSGLAGLILAAEPELNNSQLRDRLIRTADAAIYDRDVNRSYNPKLTGEVARIPLLGSGIINATAAVNPSPQSSTTSRLAQQRVTAQCGVIKGSQHSLYHWIYVLMPMLLGMALSAFQIMRAHLDHER